MLTPLPLSSSSAMTETGQCFMVPSTTVFMSLPFDRSVGVFARCASLLVSALKNITVLIYSRSRENCTRYSNVYTRFDKPRSAFKTTGQCRAFGDLLERYVTTMALPRRIDKTSFGYRKPASIKWWASGYLVDRPFPTDCNSVRYKEPISSAANSAQKSCHLVFHGLRLTI